MIFHDVYWKVLWHLFSDAEQFEIYDAWKSIKTTSISELRFLKSKLNSVNGNVKQLWGAPVQDEAHQTVIRHFTQMVKQSITNTLILLKKEKKWNKKKCYGLIWQSHKFLLFTKCFSFFCYSIQRYVMNYLGDTKCQRERCVTSTNHCHKSV